MAAAQLSSQSTSRAASARTAPALDVVIVVCDGARELTRACLESLREHPLRSAPMSVHVVDNASSDGTAEMITADFDEVTLRRMSWNSGFCIANNVALRDTDAPYALLLNPDTVVSEGALDHMVELMERRREIGIAGCRLVQLDGTFDHAAKRAFPTPLGALAHFAGLGRGGSNGRLAQYRAPEIGEHDAGAVDAVNGAFMLVRRSAMDEVGLLDEAYWTYMEDLDWCYRFKQHGWTVYYEGGVTIVHVKGGTSVAAAGRRARHRGLRSTWAFHRGMGRFYRKFYAGRRPPLDAAVYVAIIGKFVVAATRSAIARRSLR